MPSIPFFNPFLNNLLCDPLLDLDPPVEKCWKILSTSILFFYCTFPVAVGHRNLFFPSMVSISNQLQTHAGVFLTESEQDVKSSLLRLVQQRPHQFPLAHQLEGHRLSQFGSSQPRYQVQHEVQCLQGTNGSVSTVGGGWQFREGWGYRGENTD